jgi:hypothetical protein
MCTKCSDAAILTCLRYRCYALILKGHRMVLEQHSWPPKYNTPSMTIKSYTHPHSIQISSGGRIYIPFQLPYHLSPPCSCHHQKKRSHPTPPVPSIPPWAVFSMQYTIGITSLSKPQKHNQSQSQSSCSLLVVIPSPPLCSKYNNQ